MNEILLCSHNPILIKSLYGLLRDDGYEVDIAEHPALAIQRVLSKDFEALVIDSEPFGLSAEEAIQIVRSVLPDLPVISVGPSKSDSSAFSMKMPVDLEEFKQIISDVHCYNTMHHKYQ